MDRARTVVWRYEKTDEACNVYAFEMVYTTRRVFPAPTYSAGIDFFIPLNVLSGRFPFKGNSAIIFISKGRRPQRPVDTRSHQRVAGLTNHVWEIITTCWQKKPEEHFMADR